jgi:hypothetical protein
MIGHTLFWLLKAEVQSDDGMAHRYRIILEQYLQHCGVTHRVALGHQDFLMKRLERIYDEVSGECVRGESVL